jgi:GNAT superfamily N-acetyltransferase
MVEGFGLSEVVAALLSEAAATMGHGPEATWIRFAGLMDGRPVGSAGLRVGAGVAGVYNVATPPDQRRRGIGAAMSFAAMRAAHDLGYEIALLGASPLGRGVYERLGFRDVCVVKEYTAPGSV